MRIRCACALSCHTARVAWMDKTAVSRTVIRNRRRRLFPEHKTQSQPADFDDVTIAEPHRPLYRFGIDQRSLIPRPDVVLVVALIDLRRNFRLEPALQPHRG